MAHAANGGNNNSNNNNGLPWAIIHEAPWLTSPLALFTIQGSAFLASCVCVNLVSFII